MPFLYQQMGFEDILGPIRHGLTNYLRDYPETTLLEVSIIQSPYDFRYQLAVEFSVSDMRNNRYIITDVDIGLLRGRDNAIRLVYESITASIKEYLIAIGRAVKDIRFMDNFISGAKWRLHD